MGGTMKISKKSWISTGQRVYSGVQFDLAREMRRDSESLNKRKDFDDNVEAHESTCDPWPAGWAGASEHVNGDDGTGDEHERARGCAARGYHHHFGPSHDWQVAGD